MRPYSVTSASSKPSQLYSSRAMYPPLQGSTSQTSSLRWISHRARTVSLIVQLDQSEMLTRGLTGLNLNVIVPADAGPESKLPVAVVRFGYHFEY